MFSSSIVLLFMTTALCFPHSLCSYNNDEYWHNISSPYIVNMPMPLASLISRLSSSRVVSVTEYGAKGDGRSDDTEAFDKAWKKACSMKNGIIKVPGNKKFLIGPIKFSGPCISSITMKLHGTILASADRSDYKDDTRHWIIFNSITNFRVFGGGTFDGNGKVWWKNSCKLDKSKPCKVAPTAVTFSECKDLKVNKIGLKNAQQMTMSLERCNNVNVSSLVINSPEWSPNTDGIHIAASQNIRLSKCSIKTGDDCISIETGSRYIRVSDTFCGPGHGISIGSLGDHGSQATVSDVYVKRATLSGTTNGVRIKTWQGGSGYARKIKFEDIIMDNVANPIIIDQHYCDQEEPCTEQSKAVQVEHIEFSNIRGTSATGKAITINCSQTYKCRNIIMKNIHLKIQGGNDDAKGVCQNAYVLSTENVSPSC